MARGKMLYEGKAKTLFQGPDANTLIQYFKDDATAYNAQKHDIIQGKGALNNLLSEYFMLGLEKIGLPTHFIKRLNMREQLIRKVNIIPVEIIVRNIAAGSFSKMFNIKQGTILEEPLIEFCLKNDALGDPLISEDHILHLNLATESELNTIREIALRVNDFMCGLMYGVGIKLVDFKIECGRIHEDDDYMIILADEISPDSCRLWDLKTDEKLDKDVFRHDLGNLTDAYSEVARRFNLLREHQKHKTNTIAE